jgi:RNA polymerase sigma-70 factor (family 1)
MDINHIDLTNFNNDSHAFKKVFDQFFPSLCYFAERLISDKEEAEDIVLDLFTRLWSGKRTFESVHGLKGFLYISTRNSCLNFIQSKKKRELSKKEVIYLSQNDINGSLLDRELINAQIMQDIYRQVEELPRQCRQIFKMIFFEGLTTAEIAETLGIASKTVLNQKLKAIQLLKGELLKKKLYLPLVLLCVITHNRFMA